MAATLTPLQRFGQNAYTGMLVAHEQPVAWTTETRLFRFSEVGGKSTAFIVTKDALESFKDVEEWRVYDIQVPGGCVKVVSEAGKHGVPNRQEVHMKYKVRVTISLHAFPVNCHYAFTDWETVNQKTIQDTFDVIGRVSTAPRRDMNSSLPKLIVDLTNGDLTLTIHLLGKDATKELRQNDVLAVSSLCVREWHSLRIRELQQMRNLQTSFLSVVEKNPRKREGIPEIPELSSEPKRKAMKLSTE